MAPSLSEARSGPEPVVTGECQLGDARHITASSPRLRKEPGRLPQVPFSVGMRESVKAPLRGQTSEPRYGRVREMPLSPQPPDTLRAPSGRKRPASEPRQGASGELRARHHSSLHTLKDVMDRHRPLADVVLPCLNEAAALPWVLERIPPGWRAIVVDNGSTDGSAELAASLGAHVVGEIARGFGAACAAGLRAAAAPVVCFCDCDATLDPGLLPSLAQPVLDGEADLVLGRRRPTTQGTWPMHARLANRELARLVRRRTGLHLHDLGPMRVARREALLDLDLTDRRSGYPLQMVVRAADAGWRVREVDVPYYPRAGRSKVTGTWRGTWHAVRDMRAVLSEPPRSLAGAPR